jgi:hypothetical protein
MPILVACDCGKRFAARDHLFGRQVSCPECGGYFTVSTAGRHAIPGLFVLCDCGLAFHAPETMRGRQARCRGCGAKLQVGGPDPLGLVTSASLAHSAGLQNNALLSAPLTSPSPAADDNAIPWTALKQIGLYGSIALALVILITTLIQCVSSLLSGT